MELGISSHLKKSIPVTSFEMYKKKWISECYVIQLGLYPCRAILKFTIDELVTRLEKEGCEGLTFEIRGKLPREEQQVVIGYLKPR